MCRFFSYDVLCQSHLFMYCAIAMNDYVWSTKSPRSLQPRHKIRLFVDSNLETAELCNVYVQVHIFSLMCAVGMLVFTFVSSIRCV